MTCTDTQSRLMLYHAGAADPVEREAIDAHLLDCRVCLTRYFEAKNASEDVPLSEALPSPALRARLRAEVRQLSPAAMTWRPASRRTWLLGAAVAALALLALAFSRRTESRPSPVRLIDSDQAEASLSVL